MAHMYKRDISLIVAALSIGLLAAIFMQIVYPQPLI